MKNSILYFRFWSVGELLAFFQVDRTEQKMSLFKLQSSKHIEDTSSFHQIDIVYKLVHDYLKDILPIITRNKARSFRRPLQESESQNSPTENRRTLLPSYSPLSQADPIFSLYCFLAYRSACFSESFTPVEGESKGNSLDELSFQRGVLSVCFF
ncbi:hypothetical protein Tco_1186460 [Tanacetum coccineum]